MVQAVRSGFGVSVLPCFAVHGEESVIRLTEAVVTNVEAFLVIPPDHRDTVRVRLVMDALTELFEHERTTLSGLPS